MGAWSHTSFGNDAAHDFLADIAAEGAALVVRALSDVEQIDAGEFIDADFGCSALAAAELLAAAHGRPPADFPPVAVDIASALSDDPALRLRAVAVVTRIMDDGDSELRDLWQDSESWDDWRTDVLDLLERLK